MISSISRAAIKVYTKLKRSSRVASLLVENTHPVIDSIHVVIIKLIFAPDNGRIYDFRRKIQAFVNITQHLLQYIVTPA